MEFRNTLLDQFREHIACDLGVTWEYYFPSFLIHNVSRKRFAHKEVLGNDEIFKLCCFHLTNVATRNTSAVLNDDSSLLVSDIEVKHFATQTRRNELKREAWLLAFDNLKGIVLVESLEDFLRGIT